MTQATDDLDGMSGGADLAIAARDFAVDNRGMAQDRLERTPTDVKNAAAEALRDPRLLWRIVDDIGRAVFYAEDERFLVEKDDHVSHYDVVFEAGRESGRADGTGTTP